MPGNKYISNNNGQLKEVVATQVSLGVADANKIPALDTTGRFDISLMPVGITPEVANITTSEALAAGDFVNIHNSSGAKVRKADASSVGKEAHGFVLSSFANGAVATVYFEGSNTQVSGMTPGVVFLSTTPGLATATPPSLAGQVTQILGIATSASSINFEPEQRIELA